MRHIILTIALGLAAIPGVSAQEPASSGASASTTAGAALADASGRSVGTARLQQTPHGVLILLELRNATPGVHGLHVHETGRCEGPAFQSAGSHHAADAQKHGFLTAAGPHAGDLPNIHIPANGELTVEYLMPNLTLDAGPRSLLDTSGAAIVIHAGKDDYATDPAGAAGDRYACGAIVRQ